MITRTYMRALWHGQTIGNQGSKARSDKRGRPKTKLTDDECLECRARAEFHGDIWPHWKLADHYGVTLQHIDYLMSYTSRIHLQPEPRHANLEAH